MEERTAEPASGGRLLWLLRHAKAVSESPSGGDRERPLAPRGRRDAAALGKALATGSGPFGTGRAERPELVVCSPALRTRQTADLLLEPVRPPCPLELAGDLYAADVDTALTVVRGLGEGASSVLVVGHNPTMWELAVELAADVPGEGDDPGARRAEIRARGFPTCALAALYFPVERWREVELGTGELRELFTPPY